MGRAKGGPNHNAGAGAGRRNPRPPAVPSADRERKRLLDAAERDEQAALDARYAFGEKCDELGLNKHTLTVALQYESNLVFSRLSRALGRSSELRRAYDRGERFPDEPPEQTATLHPALTRDSMTELFGFEHGGLRAEAYAVDIEDHYASTQIVVRDRAGQVVGLAERSFTCEPPRDPAAGPWTASLDTLELSPEMQRRGFGSAYNEALIARLRALGCFDYARQHGGWTVGGYQAARLGFGFDPTVGSARKQARYIWEKTGYKTCEALQAQGRITREQADGAADLLLRTSAVTPQRIAQFGRECAWRDERGRELWLGKAMLLGADWEGRLPLKPRRRR